MLNGMCGTQNTQFFALMYDINHIQSLQITIILNYYGLWNYLMYKMNLK